MSVKFHPYNPLESLERIILNADGSPLQGEIDIYIVWMLYLILSESK